MGVTILIAVGYSINYTEEQNTIANNRCLNTNNKKYITLSVTVLFSIATVLFNILMARLSDLIEL